MDGSYDVVFGGQAVGKVQVKREGLYYRFLCRCSLTGDVVCRLVAVYGDRQESLGILVPRDGGFTLETRLAAKNLGQGIPEFRVVPNRTVLRGRFVPICPEEPFAYLARLKDAYLARQNGQVGAVIQEKAGT